MVGCRGLGSAEVEAVKEAFKGRYATRNRALFVLGIKTGFRISELLSLRIIDVLKHGEIANSITVWRRSMKGKQQSRTVPLHKEAKEALQDYLEELKEVPFTAPLFFSRKGQHQSSITRVQASRILKKAFTDCKLKGRLGTNSMRKTFAQRVLRAAGGDLVITRKALGHSQLKTTASYLDATEQAVGSDAAMSFDELQSLVEVLRLAAVGVEVGQAP